MAERLSGEDAARRLKGEDTSPLEAKVRAELRPEVEDEVRDELEPKFDADKALEKDKAVRALALSVMLIVGVFLGISIPLVGALFGLAVRLYHLAAGQ